MLRAHKVFPRKSVLSFGLCKKKKIGAKNKTFVRHVCLFHIDHNIYFFCEIIRTLIDCRDVYAKFFVGIFYN
jgi:hypothetical protein